MESYPRLASLFDNSKCENVITHKDDCQDAECLRLDDCRLDRGSPYCYKASKDAHALLDPYWIEGTAMHVKRTALRWMFILRSDNVSPPVVEVEVEDALRMLESGESLGIRRGLTPSKNDPYYNPHLLAATPEQMELQRSFFERLLENISCYLFNSGVASAEEIKRIVTGEAKTEE